MSYIEYLVKKISSELVEDLFDIGNESNSPIKRIEFKSGTYLGNEKSHGGLSKESLKIFFNQKLRKYLSDN